MPIVLLRAEVHAKLQRIAHTAEISYFVKQVFLWSYLASSVINGFRTSENRCFLSFFRHRGAVCSHLMLNLIWRYVNDIT